MLIAAIQPLLTNAERAIIEERKVRDYLLTPLHVRGRHKARMFAAALGYGRSDHPRLIGQIKEGILAYEAVAVDHGPHGEQLRVEVVSLAPQDRRSSAPSGSPGLARMSRGPTRSSDPRRRRTPPPPRFELLQVVYVREAHPELGLVKGECGTIVETLEEPYPAYLVEFIEDDGRTKADAIFTAEHLSATPPPP